MIEGHPRRDAMHADLRRARERFRSPRFVDALRAVMAGRLGLVAIDEAHCISEWGHRLPPRLPADRRGRCAELGAPRTAAFTATATPEVRRDIAHQLGFDRSPQLHVRGFYRPNLHYAVERVSGGDDKPDKLVELVRTREGGVALVYASTRKNAEKYAAALKTAGMRTRVYHAGLEGVVRERNQDVFMSGQLDVIVATNAFGMGVDKSDIRLVVHADIPRSPEAYYQEAGRGGRDGKPTRCVLLFNHGDIRLQEFLIEASYPTAEILRGIWKLLRDRPELGALTPYDDELEARLKANLPGDVKGATMGAALRVLERHGMLRRDDERLSASRPEPGTYPPLDVESLARRAEVERSKLRTMVEYAYYPRCRRQFVLEYFGDQDWTDRGRTCGACDTCEAIAHGRSSTMVLSAAERDGDPRLARAGRRAARPVRPHAGRQARRRQRRRSAVRGAARAQLPARLARAARARSAALARGRRPGRGVARRVPHGDDHPARRAGSRRSASSSLGRRSACRCRRYDEVALCALLARAEQMPRSLRCPASVLVRSLGTADCRDIWLVGDALSDRVGHRFRECASVM